VVTHFQEYAIMSIKNPAFCALALSAAATSFAAPPANVAGKISAVNTNFAPHGDYPFSGSK
jgi:hypothetical protein